MYVTKEEFDELVKKVEVFRKITSACHGTMTKIKEQFKDHQKKVENFENIVEENKLAEIDSSIERIKEEQRVTSEGIISIDQKLLLLEQYQNSMEGNIETNVTDIARNNNVLKEFNEKVAFLSSRITAKETTDEISSTKKKCELCNSYFENEKSLKSHMKAKHHRNISCHQCDRKFAMNCDLETHLVSEHGQSKNYMCQLCDMSFILEWRLQKHVEGHSKRRTCYYFNNDEDCPFQKVGCKFLHKTANKCKYADYCTRTKCQYRHK